MARWWYKLGMLEIIGAKHYLDLPTAVCETSRFIRLLQMYIDLNIWTPYDAPYMYAKLRKWERKPPKILTARSVARSQACDAHHLNGKIDSNCVLKIQLQKNLAIQTLISYMIPLFQRSRRWHNQYYTHVCELPNLCIPYPDIAYRQTVLATNLIV